MKFDFHSAGIQTRLLALVLAIFVPSAALLGWFLLAAVAEARNAAYAQVQVIADITSSNLGLVLADTESMLARLAVRPLVQAMDPQHCDPLIAQLVTLQPEYTELAIRDLAGNVICSHLPNSVRQYQPDQHPWFFEGVRSGGLFVTDALLGPVSRRWATAVMVPLQDAQGKRAGVVLTALDLARLNQRVLGALPKSDVVAVIDRQDKFLLRSIDPANWIGKASKAAINDAARGKAEGNLTATGSDGVKRLFAFTTMPTTGWRIGAGVPEAEVLASYFAQRNLTLALSGVMAALALLLAHRLAASISRPTQQLAQVAARMAGADLQARATLSGPRELRDLGMQFNQMLDIQVAANAALNESEVRYRVLVDSAPFGISVHQQGRLVFVNPAAVAMLGATAASELLGRPIMHFIHPDSSQSVRERVQAILDRGENATPQLQKFVRVDGSVIDVEVQGTAVTFQGAPAVQNSFQNVTERRQAQQALEAANQELARSNAELEQFAYVASHDLQEPLRKITAFAERLQLKYADRLGSDGQLYVERIVDATQRMRVLMENLLNFSRMTRKAGAFEPTDLNAVARGILSDLDLKIDEKEARVEVGKLSTVDALPGQMPQLLQNLIGNALKFAASDAPPLVRILSQHVSTADKIAHHLDLTRQYTQLTVEDNGIGFDPSFAEKIFVLFQRLHGRSEYEGTGIGLAICKKIVENHMGIIFAESQPGQGARFTVILPLSQANTERRNA